MDGSQRPVLVAVSHGTKDPQGRAAVARLVAAVAEATAAEVRAAFADVEEPSVSDVVESLDGRPAVLVPLLLSTGHHVEVDLGAAARRGRAVVAAALGPDDVLADLLVERLQEAAATGDDVRLVGAGSSRTRAQADVEAMAALLRDRGVAARATYLSASEPRLAEVVAHNRETGRRTVAVAYLLAPGHFATRLRRSGAAVTTGPILDADRPVPPPLVDLVLRRYAAAAARL